MCHSEMPLIVLGGDESILSVGHQGVFGFTVVPSLTWRGRRLRGPCRRALSSYIDTWRFR